MKAHDKESFYKYVSADDAKSILNSLKVKCSSPVLFNDPFDSQVNIGSTVVNGEFLIRGIVKGGMAKEILKDSCFVENQYQKHKKFLNDLNAMILEFAQEDRVFCVSEVNDSLLMWAHYAKDHKGAVIRFKCVPEKDTALCAAKQVIYSDLVPVLSMDDLLNETQTVVRRILDEFLLTKSLAWAHEKEWRVILLRKNYERDFDMRGVLEEEIDAIYLGCRMLEGDKKEIWDIIRGKRQNVRIIEAIKNEREFRLEFKEMIYSG